MQKTKAKLREEIVSLKNTIEAGRCLAQLGINTMVWHTAHCARLERLLEKYNNAHEDGPDVIVEGGAL